MIRSQFLFRPTTLSPVTRRAFTLIELLVVISIIALLISILLPALRQARLAAQQVQCLANEKQIMVASLHYSHDNEDFVPPTRFAGFMVGRDHLQYNTWRTNLTPYLSSRSANNDLWMVPIDERDEYNKVWHTVRCPAQPEVTVVGQDGRQMTYGMVGARSTEYTNGQGMQDVSGSFPHLGAFRRLDEATSASHTMTYTDVHGTDYIYPSFSVLLTPALQDLLVPARHPNRSYAAVYLDGHGGVVPFEDLRDTEHRLWYFIN